MPDRPTHPFIGGEFGHPEPDGKVPSYDEFAEQQRAAGMEPFSREQYEELRRSVSDLYAGPRTRLLTTDILMNVISEAREREYNRQVSKDTVRRLDPTGTHLLSAMMIHRHVQGRPATPHIRVRTFLKLRGSMTPEEGVMDVPFEMFESLPTPEMAKMTLSLDLPEGEES